MELHEMLKRLGESCPKAIIKFTYNPKHADRLQIQLRLPGGMESCVMVSMEGLQDAEKPMELLCGAVERLYQDWWQKIGKNLTTTFPEGL